MSKYYKAEDVHKEYYDNGFDNMTRCEAEELYADFPTIEVSEDCISRKALLEQIKGKYGDEWLFIDTIKNAPSVVSSRAEGKWTRNDYECAREFWDIETKCSICGYKLGGAEPNYCPNCGARMESDAE